MIRRPLLLRAAAALLLSSALLPAHAADHLAQVRASQTLTGATFVVPRPSLKVLIDGQPPKGLRSNRKETTFWVDLPEGRELKVTLTDANGNPVHFLRPPDGKSLLAQAKH